MFSLKPEQLKGNSLPEKTLVLTFDDGPGKSSNDGLGPKTLEIAQYLYSQDIPATFFCVGKFVEQNPSILPKVFDLGHIIGSHTVNHSDILTMHLNNEDYKNEIRLNSKIIQGFIRNNTIYFRAPWGKWDVAISERLNKELHDDFIYKGPFHWDFGGLDWHFWLKGLSAEECAKYYLNSIVSRKHGGIILMHDSTFDLPLARNRNNTYEMVKLLIPELKNLDYHFIGLDELPDTP